MYDENVKEMYRGSDTLQNKYLEMARTRFGNVLKYAEELIKANPKYERLVKAIEKDYAAQFDRLNKTSIQEFNQPLWRTVSYVPLNRLESNGDTNANRVKEDLLAGQAGAGSGPSWVDKGMTVKRMDIAPAFQKPVILGLYSTWADSLRRTEHFVNYAGYVRELNRIYMSRDSGSVKQLLDNKYGDGMRIYIEEYIKELADPTALRTRSKVGSAVRTLRGMTAPAYLGWKVSGIVKQALTSPWPYMQFINPINYTSACIEMASNPKLADVIKSKSEFMNSRVYDPMIDLIEEAQQNAGNKLSKAYTGFTKMGMQGLEWIDWACVAPGWLAAYKQKYAELSNFENQKKQTEIKIKEITKKYGDVMTAEDIEFQAEASLPTEAEIEALAVKYADDIVRQCQPSSRNTDISPLYKNGTELEKALLQFTTSLNVIWQNIRYDLPAAVKAGEMKKAVGMITGYILAGVTVGIVTEGLSSKGDKTPEEEKEEALLKTLYYGLTQFTDSVPVIGSMVTGTADTLINGTFRYGNGQDLFPALTKTQKTIEDMSKGKWDKALTDFLYALGLTTGLPVSGVKEALAVAGVGNENGENKVHLEALIGRRE